MQKKKYIYMYTITSVDWNFIIPVYIPHSPLVFILKVETVIMSFCFHNLYSGSSMGKLSLTYNKGNET